MSFGPAGTCVLETFTQHYHPISLNKTQSLAAEWQRVVMPSFPAVGLSALKPGSKKPLAFAALCKNTTLIIHLGMRQDETCEGIKRS